jgi:hypothetical protein
VDEQERQAKIAKLLALAAELRTHMKEPVSSDHSWLYDEDGFPLGNGRFDLTDIEPALKD